MTITFVDHNHGGDDALTYQTLKGDPVDRADIRVYRQEDWNAGNRSTRYSVGRSATTPKGRWLRAIPLHPGRYMVVFSKEGFEPAFAEFEV